MQEREVASTCTTFGATSAGPTWDYRVGNAAPETRQTANYIALPNNDVVKKFIIAALSHLRQEVGILARAMGHPLVVGAGSSVANQVVTFYGYLVGEARSQPGSRRVLGGDPQPCTIANKNKFAHSPHISSVVSLAFS